MPATRTLGRTILADTTVIEGTGAPPQKDAYVALRGKRIEEIGQAGDLSVRHEDVVYRLPEMTMMPGLIDAHVHLYATGSVEKPPPVKYRNELSQLIAVFNLAAHVEAGFTTIRETGSENEPVWALRFAAQQELVPSPRIVACGKVLTITGGHGTEYGVDMAWECDDAGDLIKAVRRQHHDGADYIKVIASRRSADGRGSIAAWTVEQLAEAVDAAHALGLKVAAHVMGADAIDVALRAGVDSLEHGWCGSDGLWRVAAQSGTFLIPTLSVLYRKEEYEALGRRLWPPEFDTIFGTLAERLSECRRAHILGVPLALGTDAANPGVLHGKGALELQLMVEAGLTPLEAISAGTLHAAQVCAIDDETGTLEKGKSADILVVKGDPSSDIEVLGNPQNILAVLLEGRFLKGEHDLACFHTSPEES